MIGLTWHQYGADYSIEHGHLANDDGLNTLVFMMLMTDARAKDSDELPPQADRRGWPGDSFTQSPWGSRLWLLRREKLTNQIVLKAKDFATEALTPLLKGYVKSYRVAVSRPRRGWLRLDIHLTKPDNSTIDYGISMMWEATYAL